MWAILRSSNMLSLAYLLSVVEGSLFACGVQVTRVAFEGWDRGEWTAVKRETGSVFVAWTVFCAETFQVDNESGAMSQRSVRRRRKDRGEWSSAFLVKLYTKLIFHNTEIIKLCRCQLSAEGFRLNQKSFCLGLTNLSLS